MTNKEYVRQLHERLAKTYRDLLEYWMSKNRYISKSDRLDQSLEFILDQVEHCAERLAHFSNSIN